MLNEDRLISATALRKNIDCCDFDTYTDKQTVCDQINDAPTVDAVEVVHGRWKRVEVELDRGVTTHRFACSECGFLKNTLTGNYCPNCGAKMDLEDNE